jgi:hypothetical protein
MQVVLDVGSRWVETAGMIKQMPKWMTRVLAALLLAGTYILHHAGIVPADLVWHHVNVLGLISDAVTGAAAVGLSGPALWPGLAAFVGNPGVAAAAGKAS